MPWNDAGGGPTRQMAPRRRDTLCHGRWFSLTRKLVNFCWFFFKWGLLIALAAAGGLAAYWYQQVDEEIRRHVEAQVAGHYSGLKVTVRSARLVEGEGIEVRDLTIVEPGAEGPRAELGHFEEVFLECRTELEGLLGGKPEIRRIVLRRPVLRPTRRADGSWSVAKLLPFPSFSAHPPAIQIENGSVEVFDPTRTPASTLVLRDINLLISPPEAVASPDPARPAPATRRIRGTLTGDFVRQVVIEGVAASDGSGWSFGGSIEGLEVSPEFREALPDPLAQRLSPLGSLRGQAAMDFRVSSRGGPDGQPQFAVAGQLTRGRADDAWMPRPLTDIRVGFRASNEGFSINGLHATSGQSTLALSCQRAGYDNSSPMSLSAEIRNLDVDRRLLEFLLDANCCRPAADPALADVLSGEVDASVELAFDGRVWRPRISVECLNVSLSHPRFPYRLQQTRGEIELVDDVLQARLTGYSGTQPVRITARVDRATTAPYGELVIKGDGIPLDEKMLRALDAKVQGVVRALEPRGTLNIYGRIAREQPGAPLSKYIHVGLNRCSLRYARFPYPLSNIVGKIELRDDRWVFSELQGTNDTGVVKAYGTLGRNADGENELYLHFDGQDIPLEEELCDALQRPNIQQLWCDLRLQGTLQQLTADVTYLSGRKQLTLNVWAQPKPGTISIEPVHFPYRLEDVRGELFYRDGRLSLNRLRASHGDTSLSAEVGCDILPDGSWQLQLRDLAADRLRLDRELIAALPGQFRARLAELEPQGPFNLSGTLEAGRAGQPGSPLTARWDLNLGCHQASLQCGVPLESICGSARLVGGFDGRQFHTRGEMNVDSLVSGHVQVTQLRGPFWIDDQRLLFGAWVDRPHDGRTPNSAAPENPPRSVTARMLGGTLTGDGWMDLASGSRFGIHAALVDGDLALCARDLGPSERNLQHVRGRLMASVDLRGQGRSLNMLGGSGEIKLRDADIYELPVMIAVLRSLAVGQPDPKAFSESDIKFHIEGPYVYLDQIAFRGDAISLTGEGEMDFHRNIRLTFRAMLGRSDRIPILRELMGGVSEQIMLIHVNGTLENPVTSQEALPGLNQALQQISSDPQNSNAKNSFFSEAGRWMPEAWQRTPKKR